MRVKKMQLEEPEIVSKPNFSVIQEKRKFENRKGVGLTHRPLEEKDLVKIPEPGAWVKSPKAKSLT